VGPLYGLPARISLVSLPSLHRPQFHNMTTFLLILLKKTETFREELPHGLTPKSISLPA
jgi:hypothetical protein